MRLTGEAFLDFCKWLYDKYDKGYIYLGSNEPTILNAFIIEWLDSVGIWRGVVRDILIIDKDYFSQCSWNVNIELLIDTANEIYNQKQD